MASQLHAAWKIEQPVSSQETLCKGEEKNRKAIKLFHYTTLLHLLKQCLNSHFINQNPILSLNFMKAWKIKKKNLTFIHESEVLNDSVHIIEVWSFSKVHYILLQKS